MCGNLGRFGRRFLTTRKSRVRFDDLEATYRKFCWRPAEYLPMSWLPTAWRTLGPWEPDWIRLVRLAYWEPRELQQELQGRIGRTDAGRDFLSRIGAYGPAQPSRARDRDRRRAERRKADRRAAGNAPLWAGTLHSRRAQRRRADRRR